MERGMNRSISLPAERSLVTGNIGGGQSRIARGPDGSRGFDYVRQESMVARLDPAAPPFVPKALRAEETSQRKMLKSSSMAT